MRRISAQTENRIVELWFKGLPRDTIARRTAVSGSTVSKVVGQLPEYLKELRNLSVELRKSNASPSEALRGAKLLTKLAHLDVEPDQLESFIQAFKNVSRKSDYQPKQVVQAAMKLSNLEEKSGKTYPEAIREFETKTEQTKRLEEKKLILKEETNNLQIKINEKEKERKQKLRQNRTTDKEIEYIKGLRQTCRKYGISLTDAEDLKNYLENMRETGGNPKKFVEFTKKHGSLKGRLTYLENQKQQKTLELNRRKKEIETAEDELYHVQIAVSEQRKEVDKIIERREKLKKEEAQQRTKLEAAVASLAEILKVKANVNEINKAIEATNKELTDLETAVSTQRLKLETLNSEVEELERKKQSLENEVENILKIKNYAIERKKAIADLEQRNSVLEKELAENKDRLALADTITDFLIRQPTCDFNRFHSMVETVKRTREDRSSLMKPLLPRIEEGIRMQALEAFRGDIISKTVYNIVWKQKEKYRKENGDLKEELKRKDGELAACAPIRKENEILKSIKVFVGEGQKTLKDLAEWARSILDEEIEKRANQKFDKQAAQVYGVFEWIYEKVRAWKKHQS